MSFNSLPARLLLLTVCVLASASFLRALGNRHAPKSAKQQIAELEDQWRNATLAGDTSAIDRLLSDDYVGISWNGQVTTKPMQLDRLRTRSLAISKMDVSEFKVKVLHNSVAVVTARAEVVGTNDGAQITGAFRYTRVYQRLPSGIWKITNFEATRAPRLDRPLHGHGHHPSDEPDAPELTAPAT